MLRTAECKFCRQIVSFEWPDETPLATDEAIEEASKHCHCESGRWYQDREYKVTAAKEAIDRLFTRAEEKVAAKLMKEFLYPIFDNQIYSVSINIGNGCRAEIKMVGEKFAFVRKDSTSKKETV